MTPDTTTDRGTITFADGLPGFEAQREYVLLTSPELAPFACLRGLGPDAPSFLAIDPRRVVDGYRRDLADKDRERLSATADGALVWLALVRSRDSGASVNLRAPIVINPTAMRGLQVVDTDETYPLDHPLAGR
jgi:flagellar assembly factor FliW